MTYKTVIIDDSAIQLLTTSFLVENHPKLILSGAFQNPYDGLRFALDEKVNFLFLDIHLGNIDAFELLGKIKRPCTILIDSTQNLYLSQGKEYGISHFLTKPISKKEFNQKIDQVIEDFEDNYIKSNALNPFMQNSY